MIVAGGVPRASRTEGILESSVTHAFPALEHRKIGSQGSEKGSGTTNSDHQWPPNCLPMEFDLVIGVLPRFFMSLRVPKAEVVSETKKRFENHLMTKTSIDNISV